MTEELNDMLFHHAQCVTSLLALQRCALPRVPRSFHGRHAELGTTPVASSARARPRPPSVSLLSVSPRALTCFLCIKGLQCLLSMSSASVSPDKRRKMESALNQLKKHTVVVADTGDFNGEPRGLRASPVSTNAIRAGRIWRLM